MSLVWSKLEHVFSVQRDEEEAEEEESTKPQPACVARTSPAPQQLAGQLSS